MTPKFKVGDITQERKGTHQFKILRVFTKNSMLYYELKGRNSPKSEWHKCTIDHPCHAFESEKAGWYIPSKLDSVLA